MSRGESETHERILQEAWRLMEERRGRGVRVEDIASAAGVSRQSVYLHFGSRSELLIAAVRHADRVRNLEERLVRFRAATDSVQALDEWIDFWGNYIPAIHGLASGIYSARETDDAAAAAWNDRMAAVKGACRQVIEGLERESKLKPGWTVDRAADMLWSLAAITVWENLVIECGWSTADYVKYMQEVLKRIFVKDA